MLNGTLRRDPPIQAAGGHDLAGRRDVRQDPRQVALPVARRRRGWAGARLLAVANSRPRCRGGMWSRTRLPSIRRPSARACLARSTRRPGSTAG
jgi:hypothetical protein